MAQKYVATKCWVCHHVYPFEELGRTQLPLLASKAKKRYMRTVCHGCYAAILDSWPVEKRYQLPLLHGF